MLVILKDLKSYQNQVGRCNCFDRLSTPSRKLMMSHAVHPELVEGAGDVPVTYADSSALERDFGFVPKITLREGLRKFAEWYKEYYR